MSFTPSPPFAFGAFSLTMAVSRLTGDWVGARFEPRTIMVTGSVLSAIGLAGAIATPVVIYDGGIYTAADIGDVPRIPLRQEAREELRPFEQPVIASTHVAYVGEPIAIIVADTPALAEDALEFIRLEIEPLPVVAGRADSRTNASLLFEATGRNLGIKITATIHMM